VSGRKQFDVDRALDQAMGVFWEHSYADASLELLTTATGLGRGSLYGAFGDKDALFRRALDRYSAVWSARYEAALGAYPDDPARAIEAFFDVALARIADPDLPGGCFIAQSALQSPNLTPASRTHVRALLDRQRALVRGALTTRGTGVDADAGDLDELAAYVVAVNQSLAVLSRSGSPGAELRAVVRLAVETVAHRLASVRSSAVPWSGPPCSCSTGL
jgi:AcrR family transcriptional regulator